MDTDVIQNLKTSKLTLQVQKKSICNDRYQHASNCIKQTFNVQILPKYKIKQYKFAQCSTIT